MQRNVPRRLLAVIAVLACLAGTNVVHSTDECPMDYCSDLYHSWEGNCTTLMGAKICLMQPNCDSFQSSLLLDIVNEEFDTHCSDNISGCLELQKCQELYPSAGSDCAVLQQASTCLEGLSCTDNSTVAYGNHIQAEIASHCSTAPPPTPPPICTSLFKSTSSRTLALGSTDLHPALADPSCLATDNDFLQHCTAFTFSHVRPFSFGVFASDLEIPTCSLPGWWYLLKHPHFSVQVHGLQERPGHSYTRINKVNVTFNADAACFPRRISYTAEASSPLPEQFDGPSLLPDSGPLLSLSGNGTTVVLLAPHLRVRLILRSFAGQLSVSLQVPGGLALLSEGLCYGSCPAHAKLSRSTFIYAEAQRCQLDSNEAHTLCFMDAGELDPYLQTCIFDILLSNDTALLSMSNATAQDSRQLLATPTTAPATMSSPTTLATVTSSFLDVEEGTASVPDYSHAGRLSPPPLLFLVFVTVAMAVASCSCLPVR